MSWDDLVQRAERGDLLPDSRVRQGANGPWIAAREIPHLFAAGAHEPPQADDWHCEFMGAELGPMSWDDFRRLAERGDLRPDGRVRKNLEQEWRRASTVAGLFPSGDAAAPDADFEFTESPLQEAEAPVPIPPPPPPAVADQPIPSAPAGRLKKQKKKPEKKQKPEKAPKRKVPRAPIELALPPRFVKGLAAALLLGGAGWLAYFGYTHLGSGKNDELRTATAGFEHIYDEVQKFRNNPKGGPPLGIAIQLMPRIASMRHRLSQAPAESTAGRLDMAGAQLAVMLADNGLGGAENSKYAEAEKQFLALLGDAKKQLGQ